MIMSLRSGSMCPHLYLDCRREWPQYVTKTAVCHCLSNNLQDKLVVFPQFLLQFQFYLTGQAKGAR